MFRLFVLLSVVYVTNGSPVFWREPQVLPRADGDDGEEWRLQGANIVNPSAYSIILTVLDDFHKTLTFFGRVSITFKVSQVNLTEIKLHSYETTTITSGRLRTTGAGVAVPIVEDYSDYNVKTNILTIRPTDPLQIGNYVLEFEYEGKLNAQSLNAFYRTSYVDEYGSIRYLLGTQFETIHARKVFPCFDEPGYQTVYSLVINHPLAYQAHANTAPNPDLSIA